MPQFVQQMSCKSYALFEPRLDWACGKISFLDEAVKQLQLIVPTVIQSTDKYIDTTVDAVVNRAVAVRSSYIDTTVDAIANRAAVVKASYIDTTVNAVCAEATAMKSTVATHVAAHVVPVVVPVQAKFSEVQGILVVKGLGLVASSEQLLDRYLPVPEAFDTEKTEDEETALVSRIARLPMAVPMRVTMTLYVKANGAVGAITLSGSQLAGIAMEKQSLFTQQILERSKPLMDKVSVLTTPALERVRAGKESALAKLQDGRKVVTINVNGIVIRLRLIEAKAWSLEKADVVKDNALPIVLAAIRIVHETTTRVIGQDRAALVFTKLHLPMKDEAHRA